MAQNEDIDIESIIVHKLWKKHDTIKVEMEKGGHGGGDTRLQHKIFISPNTKDPLIGLQGYVMV